MISALPSCFGEKVEQLSAESTSESEHVWVKN